MGKRRADTHTFRAPVLFDPEVEDGYMKHFVPLPEDVAAALEATGAKRFAGTLDAIPFRRVLHRRPQGDLVLKFGLGWLKDHRLKEGDELIVTNHGYNACQNTIRFVAERSGATVVVADVPFPIASKDQVTDAILDCVTSRTRLALLDHVTSATGLVYPLETIVPALRERGVESLIDGAHAPGMLDLNLDELDAGS